MFVWQKGHATNNQFTLLSGKYLVLKTLGHGENGTVYLARHLNLDVDRAIKVIPSNDSSPQWILQEAKLLKSLHHPGIPIIFDIEQDAENFYLIEEYVEGENLSEFFAHQEIISEQLFYKYFLQLCDIFSYLCSNSRETEPLYYQDLKPTHLIICGDRIKLIDYGVYSAKPGDNISLFGNVDFSAPEVLDGYFPTLRSEVFSLGQLLGYMGGHLPDNQFQKLIPIYQKATCADPSLRYETVEELRFAVEQTKTRDTGPSSCKHIAVIGSYHGCGSTHVGISLTCALNDLGYHALFLEENSGDAIRSIADSKIPLVNEAGVYHYHTFSGMPQYGPGIEINPKAEIFIHEYGCEFSQALSSSELILCIVDACPWRINRVIAMNEYLLPHKSRLIYICNSDDSDSARTLSRILRAKVYPCFRDSNPFRVTKEKNKYFKKLLRL